MSAQLTFALHELSRKIVSVHDSPRGLSCNCVCPLCHEPLVAKKGGKNVQHFAHHADTLCIGAEQTALHLLAKQIIADNTFICLPDGSIFHYDEVVTETKMHNFIPDLVLKNGNRQLIVEICVTHPVGESKEKTIRQKGLQALEINLSLVDRDISSELLEKILIDETGVKKMLGVPSLCDEPSPPATYDFWDMVFVILGLILSIVLIRKLVFQRAGSAR